MTTTTLLNAATFGTGPGEGFEPPINGTLTITVSGNSSATAGIVMEADNGAGWNPNLLSNGVYTHADGSGTYTISFNVTNIIGLRAMLLAVQSEPVTVTASW